MSLRARSSTSMTNTINQTVCVIFVKSQFFVSDLSVLSSFAFLFITFSTYRKLFFEKYTHFVARVLHVASTQADSASS